MPKIPFALSMVLAAAALSLCACGGSGGQSPAPFGPELVEGTYRFIQLESNQSGEAVASTGVYEPVGTNLILSNVYAASEGSGGPAGGGGIGVPFNVLADRTFTLVNADIRGRITPDGMLATAVSTTVATDSLLTVLVRHQETPLLSDLAGDWKTISYGRSGNLNYTAVARVGDATIDANGELTYSQITSNYDGQIDPLPILLVPSQFVLLAGGELALQTLGALSQRGGVSQDGNVILLAGSFTSGVPFISVMVRKGTAAPSDVVGSYWSSAIEFDGPVPRAQWGTLDRPLQGGDAIAQTSFLIGGVVSGPTQITYGHGVLPNGELTLVLPNGPIQEIYRGMAAAGGAYAFVGGAISPGSGRTFTVLVR